MNSPNKRQLIEGRPALIVIDIQNDTFMDRSDEAIPSMPGYAERMLEARATMTQYADKRNDAA